MRTASLALGIIGGVFGILAGALGLLSGGLGVAAEQAEGPALLELGLVAVLLGVVGMAGGLLARSRPGVAAALQFAAGVGGFVVATLFWLPAGLLLIAGALLLAFSGRRMAPRRSERRAGQVTARRLRRGR
jgi:hypothetical protein